MTARPAAANERVVYVLGAGFSAPLGLPVVSNFLEKARDQYAREQDKFVHFKSVFNRINQLARVRSAYHSPLHNIEEVLSLVEMQDALQGKRSTKPLQRFICDVIEYYTPKAPISKATSLSTWHSFAHGIGSDYDPYLKFVACLFGLEVQGRRGDIRSPDGPPLSSGIRAVPDVEYSVITLNYDLVLEVCAEAISAWVGRKVQFAKGGTWDGQPLESVVLSKLHGDVATRSIVPPTWSKGQQRSVMSEWRRAFSALREATQIRVVGYSLAESDNYVRYLLKSAALDSDRLKRFDVLCLDDKNGSVAERYRQFVDLPQLRIESRSITELLRGIQPPKLTTPTSDTGRLVFDGLESAHEEVFGKLT